MESASPGAQLVGGSRRLLAVVVFHIAVLGSLLGCGVYLITQSANPPLEAAALDLSTLDAAHVSAPAPAPDTAGSVFDQTVLTFSRIFGAPAEAAAASSVVPAPGTDVG